MDYQKKFQESVKLLEPISIEGSYAVWVMGLYLEEPDLKALAALALVDGPNDKKIDFIYLDHDAKRLIFAQSYYTTQIGKDTAPANKASDLNTASAWLISGDLQHIPENTREIIADCRESLETDQIESIDLLYVHNLPESLNVARELQTVQEHLRSSLNSKAINVRAIEMGKTKTQHLFDSQDSHIEVKDTIDLPSQEGFSEIGPNWKAFVTSVPGDWLHRIYDEYDDRLFSANYRGFLGAGRRRRVNSGIQESAENRSADFWAFNNGITILTNALDNNKGKRSLRGMSIINGAQTTGSIGSVDLKKKAVKDVRVLCRIIESSDPNTIDDIVKFNNTQNAITTWDQYSNDPEQKRIAAEFRDLGFQYYIKRGFNVTGDQLSIDEVIQPLLAFHGRPADAVRGKNGIFDRKALYNNAFEGKKARHVLFVCSLARAIDEKRLALKGKSNLDNLISLESDQLVLMRNLRFKPFFVRLMATTIEPALGKRCDPLAIAFTPEAAKNNSLKECTALWFPLVDTLLALVTASETAKEFGANLRNDSFIPNCARQIGALLHAMGASQKHSDFAKSVSVT